MTKEIVIENIIGIGCEAVAYNQVLKKPEFHTISGYSILYSESKCVKTISIIYRTEDGYIFTNVLEEPKITDLFANIDELNNIKNFLYHQSSEASEEIYKTE